ncbi:MAG: IS110 family transposase [Chloroflexota bacterium]|nr:IS110 family transposase [Chloroflexota bacterium]
MRRADAAHELQLLVEARENLMAEATRTRNRLHADLLVLLPGSSGSLVGPRALAILAAGCDAAPVSTPSWPESGCAAAFDVEAVEHRYPRLRAARRGPTS